MPGMASWRELYRLEYQQLSEEGYDVADAAPPDTGANYNASASSVSSAQSRDTLGEDYWERAYGELWALRERGLRADYPYSEPDDLSEILADPAAPMPPLEPLAPESIPDRIAGAWLGRCAGVTLGKPIEMWRAQEIKAYLQDADAWPLTTWVPSRSPSYSKQPHCPNATLGNISYVPVDDDVSYTLTALRLVEQHGRDFTRLDVCRNWLSNLPYGPLYSCTKQSYWHLTDVPSGQLTDEFVGTLPLRINPMREGLNASIRIDLFGFISPADPLGAVVMAHRNASVNSVKNGIYAATFVASCIAAALSARPSVRSILDAGLAAIPRRSRLAEAIALTCEWYEQAGGDWEPVCHRIFERWGHLNWAGAMLNYPLVALALLHGNLDFGKTICTAVMCGIDTDCTAGTLGGIIGAAVGKHGIDRSWYEPFGDRVRTFVADNGGGDGTISDLVRRTVALTAGGA